MHAIIPPSPNEGQYSPAQFVFELKQNLVAAAEFVLVRRAHAQRVAKGRYDRSVYTPELGPRSYVFLRVKVSGRVSAILFRPWSGPWQILSGKGVVATIPTRMTACVLLLSLCYWPIVLFLHVNI